MSAEERFAMAGLTAGQLNAIVKKLGGKEGALCFLRGETVVRSAAGFDPSSSWKIVERSIKEGSTIQDFVNEWIIARVKDDEDLELDLVIEPSSEFQGLLLIER